MPSPEGRMRIDRLLPRSSSPSSLSILSPLLSLYCGRTRDALGPRNRRQDLFISFLGVAISLRL